MALMDLMSSGLPLNRKERFYTGTVFPMIVCRDGFRHFDIFLSLLGIQRGFVAEPGSRACNVQFFTEYNLAESIFRPEDRRRFPEPRPGGDTPDALILIGDAPRTLIALEGKMFDSPTQADLQQQMRAQARVVEYMAKTLAIGADAIKHALLLPERLSRACGTLAHPVVTWEAILRSYAPVLGADYFIEMLGIALESQTALAAVPAPFNQNMEEELTGQEIFDRYNANPEAQWTIGRTGGLNGPKVRRDIETNRWRTQRYQTSARARPINRNWFHVADFIARIR